MNAGLTPFNIPFMRWRRAGFFLSGAITVLAVLSVVLWSLNFGIDFAGGSLWTIRFSQPVTDQQLTEFFSEQGLDNPVVQRVEQVGAAGSEFLIRTHPVGDEARQAILAGLGQRFGEFELLRFDDVSPSIGEEIQTNAVKALIFAVAGMIIYITLRFEYRFALTAIAGLVHDIIVVVGVYSLFRFEVDTAFIAAVLTVFGYSVNDTIIVYDRIRENRRHYRRDQLVELVNDSVNQTFTRTITTSVTTILALVAIAVFGGVTLRPFAIALIAGIVAGTYSTIFVASALWLEWRLKSAGRREATTSP